MRSLQVVLVSSIGVLALGVAIVAFAPELTSKIASTSQFAMFRAAVNIHHQLYGTNVRTFLFCLLLTVYTSVFDKTQRGNFIYVQNFKEFAFRRCREGA